MAVLGPQVDAQGQDPIDQLGVGVTDHGVVGEVLLRLLAESLAFRPFDGGHAPGAHRLGALAESGHHLLRVEHVGQRRGCRATASPSSVRAGTDARIGDCQRPGRTVGPSPHPGQPRTAPDRPERPPRPQ